MHFQCKLIELVFLYMPKLDHDIIITMSPAYYK